MSTKKERMHERVEQHGRHLLAIYHGATEQDPFKLCRRLRRLELRAERAATAFSNGYLDQDKADRELDRVRLLAAKLLGDGPAVFVNRDPRGYALKIDSDTVHALSLVIMRDWGGNGIIAPDLSDD